MLSKILKCTDIRHTFFLLPKELYCCTTVRPKNVLVFICYLLLKAHSLEQTPNPDATTGTH